MHNFFITVTNSKNRPILMSSAGRVNLGRNKKQKISNQAVEEIAASVARQLIDGNYNRRVNIFFKSNLLNKRIKLALKTLVKRGLIIKSFYEISPKPHSRGLRLPKIRRI